VKTLAQALHARREFSPRGSNCPICKREFRKEGCPHSITEALEKLEQDVFDARFREARKKEKR